MKRPARRAVAGRPCRVKRNLCACGCSECFVGRRMERAWRVRVPGGAMLVFKSLSCLEQYGKSIHRCLPEVRECICATLAPVVRGSGRAPIMRVFLALQKLPCRGSEPNINATPYVDMSVQTHFNEEALQEFGHIYLVFLCEFHYRSGKSPAFPLLEELLNGWEFRQGFCDFQRCTFYAMFDTTSLWIAKNWLIAKSKHVLSGPRLLMNLVLAVVCFNLVLWTTYAKMT